MHNIQIFLAFLICLGANGVQSANPVTEPMDDYIRQVQKQYDTKIKELEDEMAKFREVYTGELRGIGVHADLLEVKLAEIDVRLTPIQLIDSWHKQCVQNYSVEIPLVATVKANIAYCASSAQTYITTILTNAQSTYTTLNSYYKSNFVSMRADCEKKHPTSQENYTSCITTGVNTANTYTVNTQKTFDTYMQQAKCSAETRLNTAWECSFNHFYSTITVLGRVTRLIDDCIDNRLTCAMSSCSIGCNSYMDVQWKESYFQAATISNPFLGLSNKTSCMNVKFKV